MARTVWERIKRARTSTDERRCNEIARLTDLNERAAACLFREARSIVEYPFELHEVAQRLRMMADQLKAPKERLPVLVALRKIALAIEVCCGFCVPLSKPVSVSVVVKCDDGLSHEWERDLLVGGESIERKSL